MSVWIFPYLLIYKGSVNCTKYKIKANKSEDVIENKNFVDKQNVKINPEYKRNCLMKDLNKLLVERIFYGVIWWIY